MHNHNRHPSRRDTARDLLRPHTSTSSADSRRIRHKQDRHTVRQAIHHAMRGTTHLRHTSTLDDTELDDSWCDILDPVINPHRVRSYWDDGGYTTPRARLLLRWADHHLARGTEPATLHTWLGHDAPGRSAIDTINWHRTIDQWIADSAERTRRIRTAHDNTLAAWVDVGEQILISGHHTTINRWLADRSYPKLDGQHTLHTWAERMTVTATRERYSYQHYRHQRQFAAEQDTRSCPLHEPHLINIVRCLIDHVPGTHLHPTHPPHPHWP
jgi:hypothetical protein